MLTVNLNVIDHTEFVGCAGYLPPSKGTAFINGFDITRDMDKIRRNLGLCPQHNIHVLYDELTVKEHLLFFAIVSGHFFTVAQS